MKYKKLMKHLYTWLKKVQVSIHEDDTWLYQNEKDLEKISKILRKAAKLLKINHKELSRDF